MTPLALTFPSSRRWECRLGRQMLTVPRSDRCLVQLDLMSSSRRKADGKEGGATGSRGLFRAILAGPGHTLADAFANLEQAPQVERVWRHPKRDLLGARITLAPEEGEGYWELTRVRDEIYVVIANFAYKEPRLELVPGDGMVQFNFKISGDMALAVSRTEPLRWNRPSLLLWSQPTGVDISEWTAASTREQFIIVSMRPEFLAEQILTTGVEVPEPLKAFVSNKPEINYHQHPLTAQTFEIATRLINNPFTGALALVYTEALALELLCSAVGKFLASVEHHQRGIHGARVAVSSHGAQRSDASVRAGPDDRQARARCGNVQVHPNPGIQGGVRRDYLRFQPALPDAARAHTDARPELVGGKGERGRRLFPLDVVHDRFSAPFRHTAHRRPSCQVTLGNDVQASIAATGPLFAGKNHAFCPRAQPAVAVLAGSGAADFPPIRLSGLLAIARRREGRRLWPRVRFYLGRHL